MTIRRLMLKLGYVCARDVDARIKAAYQEGFKAAQAWETRPNVTTMLALDRIQRQVKRGKVDA